MNADASPPPVSQAVSLFVMRRAADAAALLEKQTDSVRVAKAYADVVKAIYREHHDISAMLDAAEAGQRFCLVSAAARAADSAAARELGRLAKELTYNAANNCWPGWDEEGVEIDAEHLRRADVLARASERLVQDLDLDHRQAGNAAWLVGALALARDERDAARHEFELAAAAFAKGGDTAYELMARAYSALVADLQSSGRSRRESLGAAVQALRDEGSGDATFFADQLGTAQRLFGRPATR
ncbi:MAG: hypothetical protein M3O01_09295 [Pseudomonadota bacterium]|nr:hypothetical protein [Pseudomonadota bacterium]